MTNFSEETKFFPDFFFPDKVYNNVKIKKWENRDVKPFLSAKEINNVQSQWIKINQSLFARDKIGSLKRKLNLVINGNIYRCEGRLRESPLPFEVKTDILINSSHRLAELIVTDLPIHICIYISKMSEVIC